MQFPKLHFYSTDTFESWDYRNPDVQGIGGSETCQIELAKRFAQRGYKVTSYGPILGDTISLYAGVEWKHHSQADFNDEGIWILSRCLHVLDNCTPTKNRRFWLICQDEDYDPSLRAEFYHPWNEERREKLEKIIALCPEQYNNLYYKYGDIRSKLSLGANGIRSDLIREVLKENITRDSKKIIYFSSPFRGLLESLLIFRKVKEYIPDIRLTIGYGFDNCLKVLSKGERPELIKKKKLIEELMDQDNIEWKGRLPQKELYREIASSNIWLYPTNFFETGCIASMEAQALGAIPLSSQLGALSHNVQYGEIIDSDVSNSFTICQFAKSLRDLLQQGLLLEFIRPKMIDWAIGNFNWERVVDKYESWVHNFDSSHYINAQSIFQLTHSEGNILNIGCNDDRANFNNLGATNIDVREIDPASNVPNKAHIIADSRNLPHSLYGQYDTVILGEILEHFIEDKDVLKTLEESKKALKPNGKIVITVPEDSRPPEEQHKIVVKVEDYAEGACSYHHKPITQDILYKWLSESSLTPLLYRPIDYGFFQGHGVVAAC